MAHIERNNLNGPRVVAIAYDNLSVFEFGIAVEVFGLNRPELGNSWYQFSVCTVDGQNIAGTGGVQIVIDRDLSELENADIIVIPGWRAPYTVIPDNLKTALWEAHERGVRIVGICGGAFVLAASGLLNGKRATTHWQFIDKFLKQYPDVRMETAPLFCAENKLYTSAGSAAGIDLCLHVVKEDYGLEIANVVAKRLVVSPIRSGNQPQAIEQSFLPQDKHARFSDLLDWLKINIAVRCTIDQAADKANLSPRTFLRHFKQVTGLSFGDWMALQRIERAKTLLAETRLPIETISEACGYSSSGSLRRLFNEIVACSPSTFRKQKQELHPTS